MDFLIYSLFVVKKAKKEIKIEAGQALRFRLRYSSPYQL
jgi:hypothetical protein